MHFQQSGEISAETRCNASSRPSAESNSSENAFGRENVRKEKTWTRLARIVQNRGVEQTCPAILRTNNEKCHNHYAWTLKGRRSRSQRGGSAAQPPTISKDDLPGGGIAGRAAGCPRCGAGQGRRRRSQRTDSAGRHRDWQPRHLRSRMFPSGTGCAVRCHQRCKSCSSRGHQEKGG